MEELDAGIAMTFGATALKDRADTHEAVLEELYDQYAHALYRYALALVSRPEDAEDAVQEVFVRLAREHRRLRKTRSMKPYLFAAARNAAYSMLRSRRRRKEVDDGTRFELEASTPDGGDRTETMALRQALAELPTEQREVLVLKAFDEMTFDEIARTIGASINTVASRYRYGIEKLRRALGEDGNG